MKDLPVDKGWTLFLDRDGVINERKMGGYIEHPGEFRFLPGAEEAIVLLSKIFGRVFVVTNQQGIAKGIMTERNLSEIHAYMYDEIVRKGGAITRCYFSPELKGENAVLRKPKPGMALQAQKDFPEVDFERSVMVGDTDSDIVFGRNLGMKTVRVRTIEPIGVEADLTVDSLTELASIWKR